MTFIENLHNAFEFGDLDAIETGILISKFGVDLIDAYMQHPEVQNFMKSNKKFDICVMEAFNADAFVVSFIAKPTTNRKNQ